jgi:hypothetical protein
LFGIGVAIAKILDRNSLQADDGKLFLRTPMATDYILFVHGVKTRDEDKFCQLATTLFQ